MLSQLDPVWLATDLSDGAKVTFWVARSMTETPTLQRLMHIRDVSFRTIKHHILQLERAGLVRRVYVPGARGGVLMQLQIISSKEGDK